MPDANVRLRIDSLVLSGIERHQQPAFLAALQQELRAGMAQLGGFGGNLEQRTLRLSAPADVDAGDTAALACVLARQIIDGALSRTPRTKRAGVAAERAPDHG